MSILLTSVPGTDAKYRNSALGPVIGHQRTSGGEVARLGEHDCLRRSAVILVERMRLDFGFDTDGLGEMTLDGISSYWMRCIQRLKLLRCEQE
jgi:hypothetical protein